MFDGGIEILQTFADGAGEIADSVPETPAVSEIMSKIVLGFGVFSTSIGFIGWALSSFVDMRGGAGDGEN